MSETVLEAKNIKKYFGGIKAVDGVSLAINDGDITGLIGPNGAGKTTFFKCLTGFEKIDKGKVWLKGKRIDGLPPYKIFHKGLSRTFQITKQLEKMTVLENLMLACKGQLGETVWNNLLIPTKVKKQEHKFQEEAIKLLKLVELENMWDELAASLSGGQKRMLEFVRTEIAEPEVILLDEPSSGVNPGLKESLSNYIKKFNREDNQTFLVIGHDMNFIMNLCDPIYVMNQGKILMKGTPGEVQNNEDVLDIYLGR